MTSGQREQLTEELAAIKQAQAPILVAMKPFTDAIAALNKFREGVLEKFGATENGNCDNCLAIMMEGDPAIIYADGPQFCEECAPTHAEFLEELREQLETEKDPEVIGLLNLSIANTEKNIASGDDPDAKHVSPL